MNSNTMSSPLSLRQIRITDAFWKKEMELVRKEVIPYQWRALNDQVEGAAPSFCMHNFKSAARQNEEKHTAGSGFQEPVYTYRGFEALPEDPEHLDDKFYGFVFQDSDFYKWIEAVGYSLTQHPDPQLEAVADEAIDIVCAAQQDDGYLDTYYILNGKDKIFSNLRDHHELYCLGHLIEGAVAYYEATGKRKLLDAACRYADYVDNYFGPEDGKCKGYPGHEIAEMALVRLSEVTGENRYLELARFFVDERGKRPYYFDTEHPEAVDKRHPEAMRYAYHQAHLPVREQSEVSGHAVRAVYLYSGMAAVAKKTGDDSLVAACERLWENCVNRNMYITGGIGSTHLGEAFSFNYDLPNDTAYAETCASIGMVFWARRMLEIKPDSRYADVMERELYNGVLSGMALDGKSFFYVNPLEVDPTACHRDERKFHVKPVRQKWFGCACCPPNIARLLSSLGSYACTENDDTLWIHLYAGRTIQKKVGGQEATITVTSEFPWNGRVQISVTGTDKPFTLALRMPDWCERVTLGRSWANDALTVESGAIRSDKSADAAGKNTGVGEVDSNTVCADRAALQAGYLYLTRCWADGDVLTLDFPMEIRILQASDRVREDFGKVALMRGPLVYCMESADNGDELYRIALDCAKEIRTEAKEIPAGEDVAPEKVTALRARGYRQGSADNALYRSYQSLTEEEIELTFVPYYTWANRGENEMCVWVRGR